MHAPVTTKDPTAVEVEVQAAYLSMFPRGDLLFVPRAFGWVIECFTGNYRDYQAIDALYHDLEHTLQGTLCMARLMQRRHLTSTKPRLTNSYFELGILAILLHDSGYLKKRNDRQGTGAKYTATHVLRSAEFAADLLAEKGYNEPQIKAVQNMICCTGINTSLQTIPFQNELEKTTGFALATADLLGQMAARDYVDKLPILYEEFAEAAKFSNEGSRFLGAFASAGDLTKKTPAFWDDYVLPRLESDFLGLHRFLNDPYPSGPNPYVRRIEANMKRIKQQCAAAKA